MSESSGMPAGHVGQQVKGGAIVTGSPNVFIGCTALGKADSASACKPLCGDPVNPLLGAKLLPGEVDFALPAPSVFAFSRSYLSRDARVGPLGQGWSISGAGLELELRDDACVLTDMQGRKLTFPVLDPGHYYFSATETLWLRRGGIPESAPNGQAVGVFTPWGPNWAGVPTALQQDPTAVILLSGDSFLHFSPSAEGPWRLRSQFDRNGYATRYRWSQDGLLTSVQDSADRSYAMIYQPRSSVGSVGDEPPEMRLAGVILANPCGPIPDDFDPTANGHDWLVRYQYNTQGDLIGVYNRAGEQVRHFAWDQHMMVSHGQPGGASTDYEWDTLSPEGKVIRQQSHSGLTRTYHYHSDHTEVIDSLGRRECYEFTGEGPDQRWSAHLRADNTRITYNYNAAGLLSAIHDPLERCLRYRFDARGHLQAITYPDRSSENHTRDEETGWLLEWCSPGKRRTKITRDERGNPLSVTTPSGDLTRYHYDNPALPDRPTRLEDSSGGVRQLQWNRLGQLSQYTDCSGHSTRYQYDGEGRLTEVRSALDQPVRYHYDSAGRLIRLQRPDEQSLQYQYDALGRLIRQQGLGNQQRSLRWNPRGLLLEERDSAGRTLHYEYDQAGRLIQLTNENGAHSRFGYDALDRLIEEVGFDGRTQRYHYNDAGELIAQEDNNGQTTRYDYNRVGRMIARHLPATDSAPAQTEAFTWSPDGQLLGAENTTLGIRIERHYNRLGQLTLEAQHLGDHWSWQASHQYDARGRREQSQLGDIPPIDWLSYGPGHLLGISSGPLSIHFARNALHQETQRELYTRDEGDNRKVHLHQRQYDALGRLEQSQLKPSPDSPGALHWERRYQYDSQDQLQQLQDNRHGRIGYQYDASGRLTGSLHQQSEQSKQTQTYRFDAAGNRLDHGPQAGAAPEDWAATVAANLHNPDFNLLGEGKSQPAPTAACWPDNRILSHEGEQYHYDRIGNLIERLNPDGSRLQLGYDGANRLIRLERTKANGERWTADYGYDPLGRRLCKQVEYTDTSGHTQPTQITCYGWDGDQQSAEARLTEDGEWQMRTTLYEPGSFVPLLRIDQDKTNNDPMLLQVKRQLASAGEPMPEALRQALAEDASEPRYASYHTDHLGTPLALTDEQGQLLWEARPDDWAAIKDEQGNTEQPIRFQGQYEDEESGLHYNRHRYYDPALGRYVNQDPIGLLGGINVYDYSEGDPVLLFDPYGLTSSSDAETACNTWIDIYRDDLSEKMWEKVTKDVCENASSCRDLYLNIYSKGGIAVHPLASKVAGDCMAMGGVEAICSKPEDSKQCPKT
ncbi:RHS repeat-associated core domain-containing protein [Halopseudomonas salegens]|uniref:RHS repeat-associated core domain-containing protein n=1 Tax=Halopseudomonas salegens TaxID=1434072 RepID=A0A1H2HUQ6_9GAMM|nr:RHS repeat-associated core domain-containing protein [Halopseudomonas salegens]SDU35258.1 RHS repeat-associated core domain-containing protein [Halopseudomonas salegens]